MLKRMVHDAKLWDGNADHPGLREVAVEAFLEGLIPFPRIWGLVEEVMDQHSVMGNPGLEDLLEADKQARQIARSAFS